LKIEKLILIEEKSDQFEVAIDMDGVLSDFSRGAIEMLGTSPANNKKAFWKAMKKYNEDGNRFFVNLPMMAGADRLLKFIKNNFKNYYVLTATGTYNKDGIDAEKREWVKKHISPNMKVVTVVRSSDKAKYASPNTILIDDREASIIPWREVGGIGILHTSPDKTISELKKLLNRN